MSQSCRGWMCGDNTIFKQSDDLIPSPIGPRNQHLKSQTQYLIPKAFTQTPFGPLPRRVILGIPRILFRIPHPLPPFLTPR